MKGIHPKAFWLVLLLGAAVWVITAINSHGYYHADEHYQIIEFAGLKLGTHAPEELAWEYKAQIRSGVQPAVVYVLFSVFEQLHITDPYVQMQCLRVSWSLFCFAVLLLMLRHFSKRIIHKTARWFMLLCALFLWFTPYLAARFSSETFSGMFLLLGIVFLSGYGSGKRTFFWAGLFLGISFLARYQIGFCLLGLAGWMLVIRNKPKDVGLLLIGGFLALLIGVLIDYWFYGEWVFPAIHYVEQNVVQDVASSFGTAPWYFYFEQMLFGPGWPLGVIVFLSVIVLLVWQPKNIWLWCVIPFIVAHSFVPHKELRFLFPIVFLLPFLLTKALDLFFQLIDKQKIVRDSVRVLCIVLLALNFVGVVVLGAKAAGLGRTGITKYLHERVPEENIQLIHTAWGNPYNPWQSLPTKFYLDSLTFTRIENIHQLNAVAIEEGKTVYFSCRLLELNGYDASFLSENFEPVMYAVPLWIQKLNSYQNWFDADETLVLYQRKSP